MTEINIKTDLDQKRIYLKELFLKEPFNNYKKRIEKILFVKNELKKNEQQLYAALSSDFGHRSHYDSLLSDLLPTIQFINYTIKNLKKWMKPVRRHSGLILAPSKAEVIYQPIGVVGVIVPWNFPLYLSIPPIITALAAGNKALVKMSEFTPATNQVLINALANLSDDIIFIEGDAKVGQAFSELQFDHLFFTGSTNIGQKVAIEAAKNLVPITLELGGKSPAIITSKSILDHAVKSLVVGKVINAGQVCVAPDYVLMPEELTEDFITLFKKYYHELKFDNSSDFKLTYQHSPAHYSRAQDILKNAIDNGANIHKVDHQPEIKNQLSPILLTEADFNMRVMQEEIFQPILPILPIKDNHEALEIIRKNDHPLALYLFSDQSKDIEFYKKNVLSGGMAINDTLTHVAVDDAPFGGIGKSGIGHYHGIEGFKRMSHAKTIFKAPSYFAKNYFLLKHRHFFFSWLKKLL